MAVAGILRLLETSTVMNCPFPQRAITKNFSVRLVSSCRAQLRPHSLPLSSISRRQLYIDRAISGASLLRPGIQELISDAMRGIRRARRADESCQPQSGGYRDASKSVQAVEDEIDIVEAGLEELKPPPGSLPENEWT